MYTPNNPAAYPQYFSWKRKISHTMYSKPRKMINFAASSSILDRNSHPWILVKMALGSLAVRKVWGPIPGPIKSDSASPTAVCHHFEGSWESKLYCTIANKVTVAEMGPATRYTLLRITASIIL